MRTAMMKSISLLCTACLLIGTVIISVHAHSLTSPPPSPVQQTDQASADLKEGRRLLKRGRADQALIRFQNALNLYTTAKNLGGAAAVQNELGDLYLRQGQYPV